MKRTQDLKDSFSNSTQTINFATPITSPVQVKTKSNSNEKQNYSPPNSRAPNYKISMN